MNDGQAAANAQILVIFFAEHTAEEFRQCQIGFGEGEGFLGHGATTLLKRKGSVVRETTCH